MPATTIAFVLLRCEKNDQIAAPKVTKERIPCTAGPIVGTISPAPNAVNIPPTNAVNAAISPESKLVIS